MFFFRKNHHRKKKPGYIVVLLLVLTLLLIPAMYTIVTRISSAEATIVPIANWKFDEAAGTTTKESIANANTGTLSGATLPAWQTSDECIVGSCLYFNGSTSKVTVAGTASFKTVSMWVRPISVSSGALADFGSNIRITVSSGVLSATGFTSPTIYVDGQANTTLVANKWQHVSVTSATSVSGASMQFGSYSTTFLNGFLDEIRMYTDEQSAKVIKGDFTARNSARTISAQMGEARTDALNQGLVGYWPMNESAANTCTGGTNDSCDVSGNGNDGAWANNATTIGGKFGNGTDYDGTDDSTAVADNNLFSISNSGQMTVAAWVYPDSNSGTRNIISKGAASNYEWSLGSNGTQTQALVWNSSGTIIGQAVASTTFSASTWQHFAMTVNQTTGVINLFKNGQKIGTGTISGTYTNGTAALRFGERADGSNDYDGRIDDVRIYNRVLSPKDIDQLFNWAASPVGYWKMDENTGTIAYDSSGNGNSGGFTGATWRPGKIGSAIHADEVGADDISVPYDSEFDIPATGSFSISAWVKINADINFSNPQPIVTHGNGESAAGYGFVVRGLGGVGGDCAYAANSGTNVCLKISDGTDTYAIATSRQVAADATWHHLAVVFDRSSESKSLIYVDGVLDNSTRDGVFADIGAITSVDNFCIGGYSGFAGCQGTSSQLTLDEIKFYSYARTQGQVMEDMNGGHPLGGSPFGTQMGYWKLDDMNGTTVQDSSSNNQDLTLVNTPSWTSSGKINAGLDLETGSSQYATILDSFALSLKSSLSVAAWIKPESTTAATIFPIASKGAEYALVQFGDELRFYVGSVSNYVTTTDVNLSTGTWYHVTGTYNASTQIAKIFVNGGDKNVTITGTIPSSITDGASNFDIGRFTGEMSTQISQSSDDARQATDDSVSIIGATMESNATTEHIGLRFNSVALPQGGTVSSAYMNVAVLDTEDEPDHVITADDVDDCATFSTSSNNIDGRADTTATATWSSADLGAAASGSFHNTSSFTSVVQEVVSRGGWVTGNDMCIIITGSANAARNLTLLAYDVLPAASATFVYSSTAHTYYDGVIDEVQVYSGALSTEQVRVVANSGAASFGVLGAKESTQLSDGAGTDPIGYWNMDEGPWTNDCSTDTVLDISGNNFNGDACPSSTGPTTKGIGKVGGGGLFDGSNDRVQVAHNSAMNLTSGFTIMSWINIQGGSGSFRDVIAKGVDTAVAEDLNFYIQVNTSNLFEGGFTNSVGSFNFVQSATTPSLNTWYHVAVSFSNTDDRLRIYVNGVLENTTTVTVTPSTNSNPLLFGVGNTSSLRPFPGTLDEVKLYNYERTPAQIAYDFNRGRPIGWWKMDECTGTTMNNSGSGASINGTLTLGASGTTSSGTCTTSGAWFNGVGGKFNASMDFDGTDDYVTIADNSILDLEDGDDASFSFWFNRDSFTTDDTIFSKYDPLGSGAGYAVTIDDATDMLDFTITDGVTAYIVTTTKTFTTSGWNHGVVVWDESSAANTKIYINGQEVTTTATGTIGTIDSAANTSALLIGTLLVSPMTRPFDGKIDDVRMYRYALSATQVKKLFNNDAEARFGPSEGLPL